MGFRIRGSASRIEDFPAEDAELTHERLLHSLRFF